ncbi:flagellar motor protein MotB [Thiomicrorhabdus indica]|uniref:OmpA/MotB family protein n=1 Tax=Thiomicrorhabdus indica TaxID=2267253 RepID=UPI002AA902E7|nr:OmpA family protein [Thiomicrorhabdus indica]
MHLSSETNDNHPILSEKGLPAGTELVSGEHHSSILKRLMRASGASVSSHSAKKSWLIIYISLFSGLLAFFLLSVLLVELEFSDDKRLYQKLVKNIYMESEAYKTSYDLPWLRIENTLNHGVRLSFDTQLLHNQEILQFDSAQAKIHPDFVPYLLQVAGLLQHLKLNDDNAIRQNLSKRLQKKNKFLTMQIRVAGHTDARPMAENARFKDNVELSSFRAFAVMRYLQTHSLMPRAQFSIAGYGGFKPALSDANAPQNRRIEIYITPVIKPVGFEVLKAPVPSTIPDDSVIARGEL